MSTKANYGLSGLSGLTGVSASLQDDFQSTKVSYEWGRVRLPTLAVVTPFCGRAGSIERWWEALQEYRCREDVILFCWDNSGSEEFHQRLTAILQRQSAGWILAKDDNTPVHAEDWERRGVRCQSIYDSIFDNLFSYRSIKNVQILEDDVEISGEDYRRFGQSFLASDVDCLIGEVSRREGDREPMVYSMPTAMDDYGNLEVRMIPLPSRLSGIQVVGGGHMAVWAAKMSALRAVWGKRAAKNITGADLHWGVALRMAGLRMAVDWSVKGVHCEDVSV